MTDVGAGEDQGNGPDPADAEPLPRAQDQNPVPEDQQRHRRAHEVALPGRSRHGVRDGQGGVSVRDAVIGVE